MAHFIQIDQREMPAGVVEPVALLEVLPEAFAALGVEFMPDWNELDDQDELACAPCRTEGGVYFQLVYHSAAPAKGMEVWIAEQARDPRRELEEILKALEPVVMTVRWRHPLVRANGGVRPGWLARLVGRLGVTITRDERPDAVRPEVERRWYGGGIAVLAMVAGTVLWWQPVTEHAEVVLIVCGAMALVFLYRLCRMGSRA